MNANAERIFNPKSPNHTILISFSLLLTAWGKDFELRKANFVIQDNSRLRQGRVLLSLDFFNSVPGIDSTIVNALSRIYKKVFIIFKRMQ